jgi:hypothetical protein
MQILPRYVPAFPGALQFQTLYAVFIIKLKVYFDFYSKSLSPASIAFNLIFIFTVLRHQNQTVMNHQSVRELGFRELFFIYMNLNSDIKYWRIFMRSKWVSRTDCHFLTEDDTTNVLSGDNVINIPG